MISLLRYMGIILKKFWAEMYFIAKIPIFASYGAIILLKNENQKVLLSCSVALYVQKHGQDWDHYLPYMLYAYRVSTQESTRESPFFLMFGQDPRQPTEKALSCPTNPYMVDLDDYKSELVQGLSDAWIVAKEHI